MDVYDNKCVITTDVTLGSIMTNNALDGQKTIFYIDVKGIQYKRSGLAIGFLQLETGSIQMNNQSSNMFSENTFTFEESVNDMSNRLLDKVHDYIVDRVESYKYRTLPNAEICDALLNTLEACGHIAWPLKRKREEEIRQQQLLREQQAQAELEKRQEQIRQQLKLEGEDSGTPRVIQEFLSRAVGSTSAIAVKKIWETMPNDGSPLFDEVTTRISKAAMFERRYGSSARDVEVLFQDISTLVSGK